MERIRLERGAPDVAWMKITILTIEAATALGRINTNLLIVAQMTYKAPRPKIAQMPSFRWVVRCRRQIYSM